MRYVPLWHFEKSFVDHPVNQRVYYGGMILYSVNVGILLSKNVFDMGLVIAIFCDDPMVHSCIGFKLGIGMYKNIFNSFCSPVGAKIVNMLDRSGLCTRII